MVCKDEVLYFGFGAPKKEKYPSSMYGGFSIGL